MREHIERLALTAREQPRLSEEERDARRNRILDFLDGTVMPHARTEEDILYPEWAELVGCADPELPILLDRAAIVARIERLDETEASDVDTLEELLYACTH